MNREQAGARAHALPQWLRQKTGGNGIGDGRGNGPGAWMLAALAPSQPWTSQPRATRAAVATMTTTTCRITRAAGPTWISCKGWDMVLMS